MKAMAIYLVIHVPKEPSTGGDDDTHPPTRLEDMARDLGNESSDPRWLKTWSPDLHDERLFTLWDAIDAQAILAAIERYGFLDDMTAQPLRVQEWGPADVLVSSDI